jgi:putative RNA 2'-phosphotransferase
MNPKEVVKKSKWLSKILRHDPKSVGLELDKSGWVSVKKLLDATGITPEELKQVVEENNKKRFEFSGDKNRIRASQGHSVAVDLGYEEVSPPAWLYHGTSADLIPAIREKGLLKMDRHHVHLSVDQETAKVVATRRKSPCILAIRSGLMALTDSVKFYRSTNGVWLVDHVLPNFIHFPGDKPW